MTNTGSHHSTGNASRKRQLQIQLLKAEVVFHNQQQDAPAHCRLEILQETAVMSVICQGGCTEQRLQYT